MVQLSKNGLFWVGLVLVVLMGVSFIRSNTEHPRPLTYSDFLREVETDRVRTVRIEGPAIIGEFRSKDGGFEKFKTTAPNDDELIPLLRKRGVDIEVSDPGDQSSYVLFF